MRHSIPRHALIVAVIALAGCASSPVPITAAVPQEPDARLIGMWRGDVSADAGPLLERVPADEVAANP